MNLAGLASICLRAEDLGFADTAQRAVDDRSMWHWLYYRLSDRLSASVQTSLGLLVGIMVAGWRGTVIGRDEHRPVELETVEEVA